jgi:hypothetical protein
MPLYCLKPVDLESYRAFNVDYPKKNDSKSDLDLSLSGMKEKLG